MKTLVDALRAIAEIAPDGGMDPARAEIAALANAALAASVDMPHGFRVEIKYRADSPCGLFVHFGTMSEALLWASMQSYVAEIHIAQSVR